MVLRSCCCDWEKEDKEGVKEEIEEGGGEEARGVGTEGEGRPG